jgi:hypothetical protein
VKRRRGRPPRPPENLRIEYPDGRVIPLEVAYQGRDVHGMHVWVATQRVVMDLDEGFVVVGDLLPAMTRVHLQGIPE